MSAKPPKPGTARYRSESVMAERWLAGESMWLLSDDYDTRCEPHWETETEAILRRVLREVLEMRGATLQDSRKVRAPSKRRKR